MEHSVEFALTNRTVLRCSSLAAVALALCSAPSAIAQQVEPAPAVTAAKAFDVLAIQVKGNTILSPDEVETIVYPFMGPAKTPDDVEAARTALQKAFEAKGFATVSVFIPEQSVDSGTILLEVQAQSIGTVTVAGGKRTSESWVLSRAPSLKSGATPNFTDFQQDIVALNGSPDRKITPEVKAGVAPGTVDVVLTVEDKSPIHGSLEVNNFRSSATSDLRVAATLRYDNLWNRGDSISVSTQVAPRRMNDGTVISGNYLMHVGKVQLLAYGVYSDSNIAIVGGTSVIGRGKIFGGRAIVPLSQDAGFYQSLTVGIDWKDFKENVRLGADQDAAPIEYFPITVGWRGDWTQEKIQLHAALTTVFSLRGLGDDRQRFDYKRYGASPSFFVVKGEAGQTVTLGNEMQVDVRATGQWSPDPLISNEGFSIGGMESVRGLYESEALVDWGFALQSEVRSPDLAALFGKAEGARAVDELRFVTFVDSGFGGIHRPLVGQKRRYSLSTFGVGARVKIFNYFNGAVDVGTPIVDAPDSNAGSIFGRFRIWGEF